MAPVNDTTEVIRGFALPRVVVDVELDKEDADDMVVEVSGDEADEDGEELNDEDVACGRLDVMAIKWLLLLLLLASQCSCDTITLLIKGRKKKKTKHY